VTPAAWRLTAFHQAAAGPLTVRCQTRGRVSAGVGDFVLLFASGRHSERTWPLTAHRTSTGLVLQASVDLREAGEPLLRPGLWGVFIRRESGRRRRVLVPSDGQRLWPMLVDAAGGPYKITPIVTEQGALRVRVRRAQHYAEVDRVEVDGATVSIDAHPVPESADAGGEAQLIVQPRDGDGAALRLPVQRAGNRMRTTVDLETLLARGPEVWDLFLELEHTRLRLASRLDEIVGKKAVYSFPRHTVERGGEVVTLQPFYAFGGNGLSLRAHQEGTSGGRGTKEAVPPAATARPRARGPLGRAAISVLLAGLEQAGRVRRPRPSTGTKPKVYFVITDVSYSGGIARTVTNIANHLANDHDVEIISLLRSREQPFFRVDARVRFTYLVDRVTLREAPQHGRVPRLRRNLLRRASWLVPAQDHESGSYSLWLDLKLLQRLHSLEPGVLVTARLPFSVTAARFARAGVRTVGQEHVPFCRHNPVLQRMLRAHFPKLDAITVLTAGDETDYRDVLAGSATRVVRVPNAVPEQPPVRADPSSQRVIAAGRYTRGKGFDLLIDAFAQVVARHRDWQLRLFGGGPARAELQQRIRDAGLYNHVLLMGRTEHLADEMARSAIFVLSSRYEGFGMVLIEALAVGLPVVSFDCPRGPSEIITPDVDGTLVPPEDIDALAAAIIELIENPAKRQSYRDAALRTVTTYDIDTIGKTWRQLINDLHQTGTAR